MRNRMNVSAAAFLLSLAMVFVAGIQQESSMFPKRTAPAALVSPVVPDSLLQPDQPIALPQLGAGTTEAEAKPDAGRPPAVTGAAEQPGRQQVTVQDPDRKKPLLPVPAEPAQHAPEPDKPHKPVSSEVRAQDYIVTAYYLNIREKPGKEAAILRVIEQGTVLEVVQAEANGWLRLKGGGYVHGAYARRTSDGTAGAGEAQRFVPPSPPKGTERIAAVSSGMAPAAVKVGLPAGNPVRPSGRIDAASGLTERDIADLLEGTELAGHGLEAVILEIERDYRISAFFTIAVMKLESGNGSSRLARKKNNLFGLNAIDGDAFNKAFRFDSKADSVRTFGELIAEKYMKKGYTTVERVARKYCPANGKWPDLILKIMKRDYKKL